MAVRFWKYISSQNFLLSLPVPILMTFYFLYIGAANPHLSLTGIDGEYVYLLNGLNVSVLRFDNIGFTDHPGTPFLVLTGIFLRIGHLFFGDGDIIDDVITRPDFYLQLSSLFMLVLTTLILVWGGKRILTQTKNIAAMVFLQGAYFFSEIVLFMQTRFIVDRLLPLLAFIFSVYTILYLYNSISERKYTIISGLIMGLGFIAKFNFVVLAIIPPLIIYGKNWFRYATYFLIAAFLSFLPVITKFGNAKRFILQLFFNKGTYGGGEKGIIDTGKLLETLNNLNKYGEHFLWFFAFALISILIILISQKEGTRKKLFFLVGFIFASLLLALMVSKNFKNYYLIPTLGLSGIVTFLLWQIVSSTFRLKHLSQIILAFVLWIFLSIPTIADLNSGKELRNTKKQARLETKKFIDNNIDSDNYWFLEPGWISGPFEANGLLWGISYVAGKNDFTKNYMKAYPYVLTFEGENRPIKYFRTKDAEIDKIFNTDKPIYLFSTPGRRTKLLQQELKNQVKAVNLKVAFDTIYTNSVNNDRVIKAAFTHNNDSTSYTTISSFNSMEKEQNDWKQNALTEELSYSENYSSKIIRGNKTSSIYQSDSIQQFIKNLNSIEISCKYFQRSAKNNTRLIIDLVTIDNERLWYPVACIDYFKEVNNWDNFSYRLHIPQKFRQVQKTTIYFYNSSNKEVYIDDVEIEIKGESTIHNKNER